MKFRETGYDHPRWLKCLNNATEDVISHHDYVTWIFNFYFCDKTARIPNFVSLPEKSSIEIRSFFKAKKSGVKICREFDIVIGEKWAILIKLSRLYPARFIGTNFTIGNALGDFSLEFLQYSNLQQNSPIPIQLH